eukprot:6746741-Prorocentrum_lima.AAC.1
MALVSSISDSHHTDWGSSAVCGRAAASADKRRDVGSTQEEPSQCTQEAPIELVHFLGAEVVW